MAWPVLPWGGQCDNRHRPGRAGLRLLRPQPGPDYRKSRKVQDLGQARDYTALAVSEQADERYNLRRLERLPLHTSYPAVVERVQALASRPQLRGCNLVVGQSGVGRPVVDLLRQVRLPCDLVPVTIVGGNSESFDADGWRVSKVALVSSLIVDVQSRRLAAPPGLPLAEALVQELEGFGTQVTASGNKVFSARAGQHDDFSPRRALGGLVGRAAAAPPASTARWSGIGRGRQPPRRTTYTPTLPSCATWALGRMALPEVLTASHETA
jgi:hypothetical protein